VTAVAEEAGVQRATVYRHFADEEALFGACSAHWAALNPAPDPDAWAEIEDPGRRLRVALAELYRWYGWAQPMLDNVLRDAPLVPAMSAANAGFRRRVETVHATLMRGRSERGRRRARVAAAVGHAMAFTTWRSLVREQGLDDADAVELTVAMVLAAGVR
jgi:AcrR family transcriptional regulator